MSARRRFVFNTNTLVSAVLFEESIPDRAYRLALTLGDVLMSAETLVPHLPPSCAMARPRMKRVLFVCSQNRLRSPTAEHVFAHRSDMEVASAGLNHDADQVVTPELVVWADVIFVMERAHLNKLRKKFRRHLDGQRVICLGIPDDYEYMDPALVAMFEARVPGLLGLPAQTSSESQ